MWSRAPLFRLAIAFFSGQYLHSFVPFSYSLLLGSFLFLMLIICQYFFTQVWSYHQRHQGGVLIYMMFLFWGMICAHVNIPTISELPSKNVKALTALEITSEASVRKSSIRYKSTIVDTGSELSEHIGTQVWLYVKKDSSDYYRQGNIVCIPHIPKHIQGPQNPGEFDFREYSARQEIYGMAYENPADVHLVDSCFKHSIFQSIRKTMLQRLDESDLSHAQLGIIKALALGYKDELEQEQREDFARAGAMHVLAVSGLHVGLIYMVINVLLFVPPGFRKLRIVKAIIIIIIIWSYAGITDFSPSVMRSSTMFTFLVAGDLLGRKLSTLNSIAASAFFLVCITPNIVLQLGFQLSYLAVCGIVIFQPFLANLITTRFRAIRWIWDLTCVSLAAQLFTLPLTLHYFGHFPVYGIVANIVIIPLATGLLYSSLLLSVCPIIKWITCLLEIITDYISYFLLSITSFVAHLDGARIDIRIADRFQMVLLLLLVISLVLFLHTAKKGWLMLLGVCSIGLIGWPMIDQIEHKEDVELCIHAFPKASCISIFGSGRGILLAHEEAFKDSENIAQKVECGWLKHNFNWDQRQAQILQNAFTQITANGINKFSIRGGNLNSLPEQRGLGVLIPHKEWKDEYATQINSNQLVVLDLGLHYRDKKQWKDALSRLDMSYWDVGEKGALVLTRTDIATALETYPHTFPISSN